MPRADEGIEEVAAAAVPMKDQRAARLPTDHADVERAPGLVAHGGKRATARIRRPQDVVLAPWARECALPDRARALDAFPDRLGDAVLPGHDRSGHAEAHPLR